jgi:peptide/nickel transport system substrate-binding protein
MNLSLSRFYLKTQIKIKEMKMKKKVVWLLVSSLMVLSLVLASCGTVEEEEEVTPPPEEEEEVTPPPEEEEEEVTPPPTGGNWWDKYGEPQYGGTLTLAGGTLSPKFDTTDWTFTTTNNHFENLFHGDWTLDRKIWPFIDTAYLQKYAAPWLAESWEWVDPQTVTVHIRRGVYWQNKPPVNGREFTANDVKHHYDRALGIGSGYTKVNPLYIAHLGAIVSVTVKDNYTVDFKFNNESAMSIYVLLEMGVQNSIEAPEAVQAEGGQLSDWRKAVGTSAWMLTDFVAETSIVYSRNPNYWGYDERHPENQLPYFDKYKTIVIPDASTRLAGLRTGKIDELGASMDQSVQLSETNPELVQYKLPSFGQGLAMRCDKEPFTDIRVRKALEMALDRETIAKTYYGGVVDGKPSMITRSGVEGWTVGYDEWPQELKDEYSYNPERAKELLAEAGYPNGFKTNVVTSTMFDVDLLQIIVAYFDDINVDMEIKQMETAAYMNYIRGFNHDQMYSWFEGGLGFTPNISIQWRHSKTGPSNYTHNDDASYDALVADYFAATTEEEASRIFIEAMWKILENHWAIQVCPLASFTVFQPYIKGYSGEVLEFRNLAFYAARLWIDQDIKKSMGY